MELIGEWGRQKLMRSRRDVLLCHASLDSLLEIRVSISCQDKIANIHWKNIWLGDSTALGQMLQSPTEWPKIVLCHWCILQG